MRLTKLKTVIASLAILLLFTIAASAATITIAGTTVAPSTTYPGSTCTLRFFASQTFTANDGTVVMFGNTQSGSFYKQVDCTISGGVITIPSFTILSTTDAIDNQLATYTAIFYDSKGVKRDTFFSNFRVPISLGTSITWAQLRLHNAGQQPWRDTSVYTRTQTDLLISQVAGVNAKASTTNEGIVRVASNPADATHPTAVETGDPRLPTQAENDALAGTSGTPSSANKYVTNADSRLSGTGTRIQATNYSFNTTASTTVGAAGVKDPVDRELTYSVSTGGSIPSSGVIIFFTYTSASGETLPSNIRGVGMSNTANGSIIVSSPSPATNATGWNLYAGQGGISIVRKQNSSPIAIGTGQTLTTISTGGATKPTVNTTGGSATITVADGTYIFAPMEPDASSTSKVYQGVLVDEGTGQEEYVYVIAKPSGTSFTASFSKTHTTGFTVKSATGGIQEAIMSLPSSPNRGGTVVIPPRTTIKAPISLRQGTILMGDAAANEFDPAAGSLIIFASTEPGIGAVMSTLWGSGFNAELRNLTIQSNTNAMYAQGIMGGNSGFFVDHCYLNGNNLSTNHNTSGLRASYGTGYLRVTNSVISGAPAVALRGAYLNNAVFENILIANRIDPGDLTYKGSAFEVRADAGGPSGPAPGGFLRMKNITTENGNGTMLDLQNVNYDIEQFDVADPNFDSAVSQMKVKITTGAAISTMRLAHTVFSPTAGGGSPTVLITKDDTLQAFVNLYDLVFEDVTFDRNNVAIDAGTIAGPISVRHSHAFDATATSGPNSIINPPINGVEFCWNFNPASNTQDGLCGSTGPNKFSLVNGRTAPNSPFTFSVSGPAVFSPLRPAQLTASQNNYNPGGAAAFPSTYILLTCNAAWNITGFTTTGTKIDGQTHTFVNACLSNITLKHQDSASSPENRFLSSTGADVILAPNQSADIIFDQTNAYWRLFKRN